MTHVPLVVLPVPTLTWSNPADILAGTPLGSAQLNATASVPGAFAYNPAQGSLLQVGSGQTLSVVFTPTDTNTYASAHATVTINVLPVSGTPVKIITTSVLNRTVSDDLSVHLTFANIGGTAAANVVLTGVKIGSTLGTSLPQTHRGNRIEWLRDGLSDRPRFRRPPGVAQPADRDRHLQRGDV